MEIKRNMLGTLLTTTALGLFVASAPLDIRVSLEDGFSVGPQLAFAKGGEGGEGGDSGGEGGESGDSGGEGGESGDSGGEGGESGDSGGEGGESGDSGGEGGESGDSGGNSPDDDGTPDQGSGDAPGTPSSDPSFG